MSEYLSPTQRLMLIRGGPGVGKSALVRALAAHCELESIGGFFTESSYEAGLRVGFKVCAFREAARLVAHVDQLSSVRVGRYGVDTAALDAVMRMAFMNIASARLVFIDELGKLESKSDFFIGKLNELLASSTPMVMTAPLKGGGLLEGISARSDVISIRMSESNAEQVKAYALRWLREVNI